MMAGGLEADGPAESVSADGINSRKMGVETVVRRGEQRKEARRGGFAPSTPTKGSPLETLHCFGGHGWLTETERGTGLLVIPDL